MQHRKAPFLAAAVAAGVLCLASPASAAGTVTAVVDPSNGALRITGDAADDDIEVTQVDGAYTVTGRNGTTVNEGAAATFPQARAVVLHMGEGADRVNLTGVIVRGDLRVYGDGGSDALVLTDVRVQRNATIRGGGGDDRIVAEGCIFRRLLAIRTDGGDDTIDLHYSDMQDRTGIDSGSGDDTILFEASDFRDDTLVEGREGEDRLEVDYCGFDDDMDVHMGDDDDRVILDDSDFEKDVYVTGDSGHDDLSVRGDTRFDRFPAYRKFED